MRGWFLVVAIAVGAALAFQPGLTRAQLSGDCVGLPATVPANGGTIQGTGGRDVIAADNGIAETIYAGAGDDVICAGEGDVVYAGSGADMVQAVLAIAVYGESGADFLQATGGLLIRGGSGNDTLVDGGGSNLYGDGGSDTLVLGNLCDGGSGTDTAIGCTATVNVP
jgi:hypothetical protein